MRSRQNLTAISMSGTLSRSCNPEGGTPYRIPVVIRRIERRPYPAGMGQPSCTTKPFYNRIFAQRYDITSSKAVRGFVQVHRGPGRLFLRSEPAPPSPRVL